LKHLISKVNKLKNAQHYIKKETSTENIWKNNYKNPQIDPFQRFTFQSAQQHSRVWKNVLQPTNIKFAHVQPHFSSKKQILIRLKFMYN